MKSWLIALLVVLALAAGGGYWWYSQKQTEPISEPIDAIPESAVFLITYPNLKETWDKLEEQDYFEDFVGLAGVSKHLPVNSLIDSLLRYDPAAKKLLANSKLWSSYHAVGAGEFASLNIISSKVTSAEVIQTVQVALGGAGQLKTSTFQEKPLLQVVLKESDQTVFIAARNGLLLFADDRPLLEEALIRLTKEPTRKATEFLEALDVAGENVEANIYLNYKQLGAMNKDSIAETTNWSAFASWTELDVSLKPNGVTLNGFTLTKDSMQQFLDLFMEQTPQDIGFPEVLPSNTASFTFFGFSDALALSSDYREMLEKANELDVFQAAVDSLESDYGFDLEQNLLDLLGNTLGTCQLETDGSGKANAYLIMHTRSSELATKLLDGMASSIAEANGKAATKEDFNGNNIQQLGIGTSLSQFFPALGVQLEDPFYAVFNDHVIFAPSQSAMEIYLQYLQGDRTLAKDLAFSEFIENLSSSFTVLSYKHLHRKAESAFPENGLNPFLLLEKNEKQLKNVEACAIQLTTTGSSFYTNVFLNYNPSWQDADENAWTAQLDAEPQTTPQFVSNHVSGEMEIIVQDREDQLYLFNAVGKRLFKREIAEPIESSIVQVDAYKNKKLQYVFNTKNFIYLIDRDGNDVDGFPIELPSPAETRLSVIEYDGKRDYRLLIACKNKRIYNYSVQGKKVSGWKHNKVSNLTVHPFKHILVDRKDYLVTGEDNGKIHLLDRRGKNRVKVERYVDVSEKNELQAFASKDTRSAGVYITDDNGSIQHISLNGKVNTIDLGKFSKQHQFFVDDLNSDGLPEFIFYDLNMLQVFSQKKEKLFEQRIAPSATELQIVELSDGHKGIGFCFKDSEQLVLYDHNGNMADGFPVSGNSSFSLAYINGKRTLVGAGIGNTLTIVSLD